MTFLRTEVKNSENIISSNYLTRSIETTSEIVDVLVGTKFLFCATRMYGFH